MVDKEKRLYETLSIKRTTKDRFLKAKSVRESIDEFLNMLLQTHENTTHEDRELLAGRELS